MATWRKTLSSNQHYEVILNVNQTSQNIANNTSNISWSLQVRKSFGSGFWGLDSTASTWAVNIDGTNVSSSNSSYDFRGGASLTKTIASGTRTITHGGNGAKSIAVSGYWKDNVNGLGSATASATMALSTIPRASELAAFSFASHLKNGVANTINYTTSKKSGGFRHQLQLRDGSTTVFQWDNVGGDGSATIALSASDVNTLLTRMPTSTTKTFTLRLATRSGINGGWIGSAVTRNATATVHADVKPVLSGMTFGISGSRIDKTLNKYVQGYTKVTASVTRTAGYSSSIKETTMTVQRTDGVNSQVINGNSGTTANPLSHSGTYRVVYKATDERGRSTSATSASFTVEAYSPPSISSFTLRRGEKYPTEVTIVANGTFSSVGGSNTATLNIQRRSGSTWSDVGSNNTSTNGGITRTVVSTGNSVISSYEFKAKVTDLFGGVSESIDTVSTQQVVMDIYRNQGVAFGKMYEPAIGGGALQVGGALVGGLYVAGSAGESPLRVRGIEGNNGIETANTIDDTLYLNWVGKKPVITGGDLTVGGNATFSLNVDIIGTLKSRGSITRGAGIISSGSNGNGWYAKFNDGTLICWGFRTAGSAVNVATGSIFRNSGTEWIYPMVFLGIPSVSVNVAGMVSEAWAGMGGGATTHAKATYMVWSTWSRGTNPPTVTLLAVGRWA